VFPERTSRLQPMKDLVFHAIFRQQDLIKDKSSHFIVIEAFPPWKRSGAETVHQTSIQDLIHFPWRDHTKEETPAEPSVLRDFCMLRGLCLPGYTRKCTTCDVLLPEIGVVNMEGPACAVANR